MRSCIVLLFASLLTLCEAQETPPPSGPVSPLELIVDRVDSSSSESCDLHVTCRTHNAHISSTFRCVDRVCSQEGGERPEVTTSGASLQVYMLHKVIICNHRNQVHRTQDLIHAEHLCPKYADPLLHRGWVMASCILTVIFIVIVVVLIVWLCNDRRRLIGLTQRCLATMEGFVQDKTSAPQNPTNVVTYSSESDKALNEILAPPEKRSPADASGPSYSSVPSAAEPTDP